MRWKSFEKSSSDSERSKIISKKIFGILELSFSEKFFRNDLKISTPKNIFWNSRTLGFAGFFFSTLLSTRWIRWVYFLNAPLISEVLLLIINLNSPNIILAIYYASLLTEVKPRKVEFVENYISHFKPWSYYYEMLEFLIWSGTRSSLSQSNLSLNRSTLSRDVTQLNVFQFEKHSTIRRKTCQTRKV